MIVLGLAGKAGSGKDSVADYLVERYGFIKFSFSDALYREVAAAFGLAGEEVLRNRDTKEIPYYRLNGIYCTDPEFRAILVTHVGNETYTCSPRQVLQWWGTQYRRKQDPDYWIIQAARWLDSVRYATPYPELSPQYFVNTSVRFENERRFIEGGDDMRWGGNIWHLRRDAAAPVAAHKSETPLPVLEGEREIFNNHTLEYLHMGVDQLLSSGAKFVRLEGPAAMEDAP